MTGNTQRAWDAVTSTRVPRRTVRRAAPGMLCEGDRVTGVVLRADNRGVNVQWPVENTVQDYTWAQVEEYGFTFRRRTVGSGV